MTADVVGPPETTTDRVSPSIWGSMLARAAIAAVIALVIAFTPGHTLTFDLVAFGVLTLGSGVVVVLGTRRARALPGRASVITRGLLSLVVGLVAIMLAALPDARSTATLIWLVAGWAILAGGLWVLTAWQARPARVLARESVLIGPITLVLGVLVALVPPDLYQEYGGLEQVEGAMTATIQIGGLVGGYAAILAVLLAVEAFTLRGAQRRANRNDVRIQNAADEPATEVN
ncbi:hypothetical protein F8O01_16440 [Pseudoclavibacter chungangensis]|uniref:Uncharacterized protein n=1 Tax=Pseudoclavibacter chungangensis TaxID=587635 RepID=A0A7J5BN62_9MICO|nr:DUF308 domain-containing protein [Pseudoclavibacter chungangensis]KAB1652622.1 hypothetical protein F8O01_16440 [Pseudoclavibacter chungangensis]NYJ68377.1 uncharacterized membrane protein HdeD (DUF308 family) [Pseudoclavibacter chungangensis]